MPDKDAGFFLLGLVLMLLGTAAAIGTMAVLIQAAAAEDAGIAVGLGLGAGVLFIGSVCVFDEMRR